MPLRTTSGGGHFEYAPAEAHPLFNVLNPNAGGNGLFQAAHKMRKNPFPKKKQVLTSTFTSGGKVANTHQMSAKYRRPAWATKMPHKEPQKKVKKKKSPGTLALKEIKKYQGGYKTKGPNGGLATANVIPSAPFRRLVYELDQQQTPYGQQSGRRWGSDALAVLREALEGELVELFRLGNYEAFQASRITVTPQDMQLVRVCRGEADALVPSFSSFKAKREKDAKRARKKKALRAKLAMQAAMEQDKENEDDDDDDDDDDEEDDDDDDEA